MNVSGQLQAAVVLKAEGKEARQYSHKRKNEARSCNHTSRAKARSMTYSECMSIDIVIQHTMSMRRIGICVCPALPCFSTLFHKMYDFREKCYLTQNVCFDFLYKFCLKHFSF